MQFFSWKQQTQIVRLLDSWIPFKLREFWNFKTEWNGANFQIFLFSASRWLNKDLKLEESSVEYDTRTKSIMSQSEEGICVVEFRDSDGNVIHFEVRVIAIVELMPNFLFYWQCSPLFFRGFFIQVQMNFTLKKFWLQFFFQEFLLDCKI